MSVTTWTPQPLQAEPQAITHEWEVWAVSPRGVRFIACTDDILTASAYAEQKYLVLRTH